MTKPESIVIVENASALFNVLKSALESYDVTLQQTASAADCISRANSAALVIVDLLLDDLDGLSLIEELRQVRPELPIIAYIDQRLIRQAEISRSDLQTMSEHSGANGFFMAPINLGRLVNTIKRYAKLNLPAAAVA